MLTVEANTDTNISQIPITSKAQMLKSLARSRKDEKAGRMLEANLVLEKIRAKYHL